MEWLELKIYTTHEGIETLSASLIEEGICGLVISDPNDIVDFKENKNETWDYIDDEVIAKINDEAYITVYLENGDNLSGELSLIRNIVSKLKDGDLDNKFGRLELESNDIKEEDWANTWKEFFKPVEIGSKIVIKPTWESYDNKDNRCIVELDPETSFGTGRHFTTQLCLEMLEKYVKNGDRMCDLGCGSGIISIAGVLLGADSAVAVDIAPDAVKISKANALQNGIAEDKYIVSGGDVCSDPILKEKVGKDFDLVAANIVADVLMMMKEVFFDITRKDGILIISGVIDDRREEVFEAIKACGFEMIESCHRDMWNSAVYKKL